MIKKISNRQLLNFEVQNNASVNKNSGKIVLAIDYGEKFSGIAWTPDGLVVLPIEVCKTSDLLNFIQKNSQEKNIKYLLLGLPLSSDNSENHICKMIRGFGEKLKRKGFEIEYVNERFSSQNTISSDDDRIDDLAAAQILEFWLSQK